MTDNRYLMILAVVMLMLLSVPYLVGFIASNGQAQFGGFLINPLDGHSYLAKIQQGFHGEWKFTLPYTADPGEGAYLFLFYLGLGHLNRILQLPAIYVFHLARLLSALWLIFLIGKFMRVLFPDKEAYRIGLVLALLGSGLGWIAVLGGMFTSDFWVAEAYPFLSMYTNPHFTLGLGLMIYLILPDQEGKPGINILLGLLLGIVQPFAVVIMSLVKVVSAGWRIIEEKIAFQNILGAKWFRATVGFCLSGGAILIYQYWAIHSDPILSQWNQQNITLKPEPLDLLLSLSPCLILGIFGAQRAWNHKAGRILLFWVVISLVLVFVPWNLQRRFLTGIFFPLAGLSVFGIQYLSSRTRLNFRHWTILILVLAVPTNLIVITSGIQAISERHPKIFIPKNFIAGMKWIEKNSEVDALILVEQEDGLYVPALTGRKVIYGHPFETVRAEEEQAFLQAIFSGDQNGTDYSDLLSRRGVDYTLIKESENTAFNDWLRVNWEPVFQLDGLIIYSRQAE